MLLLMVVAKVEVEGAAFVVTAAPVLLDTVSNAVDRLALDLLAAVVIILIECSKLDEDDVLVGACVLGLERFGITGKRLSAACVLLELLD